MTSNFENEDDSFDDEIIQIYKDSSYENIEKITSLLFELESDKTNLKNILVEINRSAHTLKGDSNSIAFNEIGEIAHQMESYMHSIQKGNVTFDDRVIAELFKYMNQIKELLDAKFSDTTNDSDDKIINYGKLKFFLEEAFPILNNFSENNQNYNEIIEIFENNHTFLELDYNNKDINSIISKINNHFIKLKEKNSEQTVFLLSNYIADLNTLLSTLLQYEEKYSIETEKNSYEKDDNNKRDDKSIRVPLQKIDSLIDYSSELISNFNKYDYMISKLNEIYLSLNENNFEKINNNLFSVINLFKKENSHFHSIINNLNYDIKKTRMMPAKSLLEQMRVVAKTASMKLGKLVKFTFMGQDLEVDLFLLEKIKDPLSHIIRNSIDHGIEDKDERKLNNKSFEANLKLNVFIVGSDIVFEIKDDGKGINYEKIKNKALEIGLIDLEKAKIITKEELHLVMFMPGFSTADKVTNISGRGVGLDVVKSTVESLGGFIKISSEANKGTTFTIKISLKLTNFEALIFSIENKTFSIPVSYISNINPINLKDFITKNDKQSILFNNIEIKVFDLAEIINLKREENLSEDVFIIIISVRDEYVAFIIDSLIEIREIVMKDLGAQIKKLKNISGTTILGDGTPIFVLNPYDLISSFETSFIDGNVLEKIKLKTNKKDNVIKRKALILDDSITTRTLEKNILESIGFEVEVAINGLEGTKVIKRFNPDIIITDCEMPEMNGYEFTRWVRKSEYKDLPIIMVTSLADNEFKMQGMEAGVDSYIIKGEFNQDTFLDTIETLLL